MTHRELGEKLQTLIREEREKTNEILKLIAIALDRRSYLDLGYGSMFDWLTLGFGYSRSAAQRRIEAARLIKVVPEAAGKLKTGELNLTILAEAQSVFRTQSKKSGIPVTTTEKREALQQIEHLSKDNAKQKLLERFSKAREEIPREMKRVLDHNTTRYSLNLSNELVAKLERVKEVLSHIYPDCKDTDAIAYALDHLLKAKNTAAVLAKRRCSFVDPITQIQCTSRHQLEIDHIQPKALGGSDDPFNLRIFCRAHNMHAAEQLFGRRHMQKYRLGSKHE